MDVKGSQIKLGIDAPKDVMVNREEIHNKILAEERARQQIEEI
jgi:carbon storage regulator CsrA